MDNKFDDALNNLHRAIVNDYARGSDRDPERIVEFVEGISFEEGRKYIKVVKKLGQQSMVWGFIMKEDDKVFQKGDILKAASWAAPARNAARGNIFGEYAIRWTGPHYL
jgi:hypothetical protein